MSEENKVETAVPAAGMEDGKGETENGRGGTEGAGPGDLGAILDKWDPEKRAEGETENGKRKTEEGEGKPAAGAAAGTGPAAVPVPGATDEDLKDLPDFKGNEGVKAAFIAERIAARHRVEEARAAAKPAEDGKRKTEDGKGKTEEAAGPTAADDAKVFELRATAQRVMDGVAVDGWDEAKAQKVLKLSEDVIGEMRDEGRALEVLKLAKEGKFGELSAAMAQEIERALPTVTARARTSEKAAADEAQRASAVQKEVASEFEKVQEKYPALKELVPGKESREVKFVQQWMRDNVGTPDSPGRRFQEILNPKNIGAMMEDAMIAFRANDSAAAIAERDRLRRERDGFEKPLSGGGPGAGAGGGEPKPGSSEALKGVFAKYGK